jgi:hypothetical protein
LKLYFEPGVLIGDAEGISLRSRNQERKTKMKKAKSKKARSAAKKNPAKKQEVGGRVRGAGKNAGLQPFGAQKRAKPRLTTVPRDMETTVPRDDT